MQDSGSDENGTTAKEVNMDEYKNLSQRVESMEASVGFVLTKVEQDNYIYIYSSIEIPLD